MRDPNVLRPAGREDTDALHLVRFINPNAIHSYTYARDLQNQNYHV